MIHAFKDGNLLFLTYLNWTRSCDRFRFESDRFQTQNRIRRIRIL